MNRLIFSLKLVLVYLVVTALFFGDEIYTKYQEYKVTGENQEQLAQLEQDASFEQEYIPAKPAQIKIERLGVDLKVLDGEYDVTNSTWTLSQDSAHYALQTSLPNFDYGNTLIYGHNLDNIFGSLKDLIIGDILILSDSSGVEITYKFVGFDLLTPNDTSIFYYQGDPQLSLLTCHGLFDSERLLSKFQPVGIVSR
ncbi:sortase [Candidatus Saccharibacteria bacterium]|nr:sortase [Candidatus Saccharibacteria bacterium]